MDERKKTSWPQLFARAATRPFDYKSKASREEYWAFFCGELALLLFLKAAQSILMQIQVVLMDQFYFIGGGASFIIGPMVNMAGILTSTVSTVHFFAFIYFMFINMSLTNRRLRDLKMNTWLTPVFIIPVLNLILVLIFFTRKSPDTEAG